MSNRYTPNKWLIVKIGTEKPRYRVFGSWVGGYLSGDAWRLNSGIAGVVEREEDFEIVGGSGSVYVVHKFSYGSTLWTHSIIEAMAKQHREMFGEEVEILNEHDAVELLENWASE